MGGSVLQTHRRRFSTIYATVSTDRLWPPTDGCSRRLPTHSSRSRCHTGGAIPDVRSCRSRSSAAAAEPFTDLSLARIRPDLGAPLTRWAAHFILGTLGVIESARLKAASGDRNPIFGGNPHQIPQGQRDAGAYWSGCDQTSAHDAWI